MATKLYIIVNVFTPQTNKKQQHTPPPPPIQKTNTPPPHLKQTNKQLNKSPCVVTACWLWWNRLGCRNPVIRRPISGGGSGPRVRALLSVNFAYRTPLAAHTQRAGLWISPVCPANWAGRRHRGAGSLALGPPHQPHHSSPLVGRSECHRPESSSWNKHITLYGGARCLKDRGGKEVFLALFRTGDQNARDQAPIYSFSVKRFQWTSKRDHFVAVKSNRVFNILNTSLKFSGIVREIIFIHAEAHPHRRGRGRVRERRRLCYCCCITMGRSVLLLTRCNGVGFC